MSLKKVIDLKNSLLFRLSMLYAVIFTISTLVIFVIIYYKIYTVAIDGMDHEFIEKINDFSVLLKKEGMEGVQEEITDESTPEDPDEEFYRALSFDGNVRASSDVSGWDILQSYLVPETILSGKKTRVFETISVPSLDVKARIVTAVIGEDIVFQVGETLEEAEEYFQVFINWFLLLSVFIVVASAFSGWYLAKRALMDMEDVTHTAMEISHGSYHKRVQVKDRFIEIKRLGDTFNGMLDQIHALLRSTREVNDNIAHDLRSPLARIRGLAEMGLFSNKTPEDYWDMFVSILEECDSLIDIINTMLDITELESGAVHLREEDVDLTNVVLSALELFRPVAQDKRLQITARVPEKLGTTGDLKKLQRIVSNFLDNAIKYTPEGGVIVVTAFTDSNEIRIRFEDTGIGIAEADLPHIFDRFYRCDSSRTENGVGLGLSLAKAFTESMNGSITVESTLNEGSTFTVHLPLRKFSAPSYGKRTSDKNRASEDVTT